jgi:hypothetical protein
MFGIALVIVLTTIIAAHIIYKAYDAYNPPYVDPSDYLINQRKSMFLAKLIHNVKKRAKKRSENTVRNADNKVLANNVADLKEKGKKDKKEGFWGELPGRDMNEGSFDDPRNLHGTLGKEQPTGDLEEKKTAMRSIEAVLAATSKLQSTTEPGENRSADQIFVFHDELEGVKASISNRKIGDIWTPSEFLAHLHTDGYRNL